MTFLKSWWFHGWQDLELTVLFEKGQFPFWVCVQSTRWSVVGVSKACAKSKSTTLCTVWIKMRTEPVKWITLEVIQTRVHQYGSRRHQVTPSPTRTTWVACRPIIELHLITSFFSNLVKSLLIIELINIITVYTYISNISNNVGTLRRM